MACDEQPYLPFSYAELDMFEPREDDDDDEDDEGRCAGCGAGCDEECDPECSYYDEDFYDEDEEFIRDGFC